MNEDEVGKMSQNVLGLHQSQPECELQKWEKKLPPCTEKDGLNTDVFAEKMHQRRERGWEVFFELGGRWALHLLRI